MGRAGRAIAAAVAALAVLAVVPAARASVTERAVTFTVTNANHTLIPCAGDGRSYRVRGELIAPSTPTSAVTLYLHGLGFGGFFWHFTGVPGYDYATAAAQAGHASVVIDRLGYGASDHPAGTKSCIGAQADVAHQIVGRLRRGAYSQAGAPAPAFARVGIVGHSVGALIAELEAASFHDVAALGDVAFADLGPSPDALLTFLDSGRVCLLGGQPSGGSPGYAFFGQTAADFQRAMFFDADPAVVAAVTAMRLRDPCGDDESVPLVLPLDQLLLRTITVPVLVLLGSNDDLFPPPLSQTQRLEYTGSRDVRQEVLVDTGHAATLGRSAPAVRAALLDWLSAHGL